MKVLVCGLLLAAAVAAVVEIAAATGTLQGMHIIYMVRCRGSGTGRALEGVHT